MSRCGRSDITRWSNSSRHAVARWIHYMTKRIWHRHTINIFIKFHTLLLRAKCHIVAECTTMRHIHHVAQYRVGAGILQIDEAEKVEHYNCKSNCTKLWKKNYFKIFPSILDNFTKIVETFTYMFFSKFTADCGVPFKHYKSNITCKIHAPWMLSQLISK